MGGKERRVRRMEDKQKWKKGEEYRKENEVRKDGDAKKGSIERGGK